MRTVQTQERFPLTSIKPLEGLLAYRERCLAATRTALEGPTYRREHSPITGARLEVFGDVDGFHYGRCPDTGSVFLIELPEAPAWANLLAEMNRYRRSPEAFHFDLAQSRTDNVYAPKLEWIRETLRLQNMHQPRMLEVATAPSKFTPLLQESGMCSDVIMADEMNVAHREMQPRLLEIGQAAVLLESLDRVDDPVALLRGLTHRICAGGLLFITALVSSGFDMSVLGVRNQYLYPPDRANCFSLEGLSQILIREELTLIEVSTPGVLDVEIVRAHLEHDPSVPLSVFERQLIDGDSEAQGAVQAFLQQERLSSFTRIVARKKS